jgi:uncharacterized protein (DUF2164 family)
MAIELSKEVRAEAIASIARYFEENMDEPLGNLAAAGLLDFLLEELGPSIYNQAVADLQGRLAVRVAEVASEMEQEELPYWSRRERRGRPRR